MVSPPERAWAPEEYSPWISDRSSGLIRIVPVTVLGASRRWRATAISRMFPQADLS
jgi:hypothetical protein